MRTGREREAGADASLALQEPVDVIHFLWATQLVAEWASMDSAFLFKFGFCGDRFLRR